MFTPKKRKYVHPPLPSKDPLVHNAHKCFTHNGPKRESCQTSISRWWANKLWCVLPMGYYSGTTRMKSQARVKEKPKRRPQFKCAPKPTTQSHISKTETLWFPHNADSDLQLNFHFLHVGVTSQLPGRLATSKWVDAVFLPQRNASFRLLVTVERHVLSRSGFINWAGTRKSQLSHSPFGSLPIYQSLFLKQQNIPIK